ncbi:MULTISPECIES: chaperone SicP [Shewanella]|nr:MULTISPECIES: chaperone SicP [Shewanella]
MMNQDELLLNQVGQSLGLPLTFDTNEQCLLMLDNKLMISIHYQDELWTFYCMLAQVSNHETAQYWRLCLQLNLVLAEQGMGRISYDTDSGSLLYLMSLPMPATSDSVTEFIERLVDSYESVQARLSE